MKDFQEHRRDIQTELRSGKHQIEWREDKFSENITLHGEIPGSDVMFAFWRYNPDMPVMFSSVIKAYYDGCRKSLRIGPRKNDKIDMEFCQEWYLDFLAKERCKL